jgi:hypothetical protein
MTTILEASPLWPATLDHIRYDSPDAARLADFYVRAMGMAATELGAGEFLLEAPARSLVIGAGRSAGQPYSAFALSDEAHLDAYRAFLTSRLQSSCRHRQGLFGRDALAVRDPDGRLAVWTRTRAARAAAAVAARALRWCGSTVVPCRFRR